MNSIAVPVTAFAFSLLLASLAPAETINIPEDEPAISVNIPETWKPEAIDKGIACESPDKVATIIFEVTTEKGLDALIQETAADELMIVSDIYDHATRLRSFELVASAASIAR